MPGHQLGAVLHYLCRSIAPRGEADRTDGQLLDHFTATGNEAAFEALVRRHGPLVLSVCRSVLGNDHDTEDAFQATFLVLVKRAHAVSKRESLRSWLYGVAHRVAVRARVASAKRLKSERQVPAMPFTDPATESARQELARLLHEEVIQLPERYRLPVLLCCLEGKSRQEAARELGWTEGEVKGRLERGRRRLHAQLARRGLTLPLALAAVELARGRAVASVPLPLVMSTTKAAVRWAAGPAAAAGLISTRVTTLTEGVLKAMLLARLRLSAFVLLLLTLAGATAGLLSSWVLPGEAAAKSPPVVTEGHVGRADANILGLVAPRDAARPGAVLLHGGGRVTDDAFARFIQLAGGKRARIVLVPSAYYGPTGYASRQQFAARMKRRFSSWVRLASTGQVKKFEFLYTDRPRDADDAAFVRPLARATGVWFCGGDQARLNRRYVGNFPRLSRFQAALRDVLARGGVVGGTSAGMAALPEIMTLDQRRQRVGGPYSAVAAHGLGLFDGAIVEQHFGVRNGRLERFTGLLRDSARLDRLAGRRGAGGRMSGLAVDQATALVLQADRLEVLGGGNAHVFLKAPGDQTITWHTLKASDRATLKRDARGNVALVLGR
jgi:cyanophycinase